MKKFILLIVLVFSVLFFAGCEKDDLSDFPYPIVSEETRVMYIASEKYRHPEFSGSEQELYESPYFYIIRYDESDQWDWTTIEITGFNYKKGYEYKLRGQYIGYLMEGDILEYTFKCTKVLSKKKKQSVGLP